MYHFYAPAKCRDSQWDCLFLFPSLGVCETGAPMSGKGYCSCRRSPRGGLPQLPKANGLATPNVRLLVFVTDTYRNTISVRQDECCTLPSGDVGEVERIGI